MNAVPDHQAAINELSKIGLQAGGLLRLRIVSDSMQPLIDVGEELLVTSLPLEGIHRGDLVVYQVKSAFITHRVIAVTDEHVLTKGDNRLKIDQPVCLHNIIGITVSLERNGNPIDFRDRWWQHFNLFFGWLHASYIYFDRAIPYKSSKYILLIFHKGVFSFEKLILKMRGL